VIEVVAAVMQRAQGAFLLAQRPAGKVYAGYWEFPGGKVEPDEPAASALSRELHEELGIDVERCYPWITREHVYPHGHVRIHFFRVTRWRGVAHPREDQAISWQRIDAPMVEPMLPANAPVLAALALPVEYAITDATGMGVAAQLARLEARLEQGLKLVQVREPAMDDPEPFTRRVLDLAHRHGCRVLTKAPFPGADGLHLTARDLMQLGKKTQFTGASCHSREELERAMALGLDFAVVGPVKDKARIGWAAFASIVAGTSIPVYAIGGLTRADMEEAWRAGAHGLAMIRGAWS
jgi:8-oxo-dGTP diphosphatase